MIIITTPRTLGGLGSHLMKTGRGSNEKVIVRSELSRDVPQDVTLALRLLAAQSRRNTRVTRDIVHIVVSPKRLLDPEEFELVLRAIEKEYGIPFDAARHVTEHRKGRRAHHFHVLFAMTSHIDGKALRFGRSKERDLMVARKLEIELDEGLSPSVRPDRIAEMLRERGHHELADIAAAGPVAEPGVRRSKAEVQQAARLGVDPERVDARLLAAWRSSGGDLQRLVQHLHEDGFRFAAGNKLIRRIPMIRLIDAESLNTTSLIDHLNRVSKAAGEPARVREIEVAKACGDRRPEKEVRAALRKDAPDRSVAELLKEFDRLAHEMAADGERDQAARAKTARAKLATKLSQEERADLRQRQAQVREHYRQRDRIRRARVGRAFLAARIFSSPDLRKLAFYMAAGAALMTGAGLIAALTAGGVLVAMLPDRRAAHQARAGADAERQADRQVMAADLGRTSKAFFRERTAAQAAERRLTRQRAQQQRTAWEVRRRNEERAQEGERQRLTEQARRIGETELRRQRERANLLRKGSRFGGTPGVENPAQRVRRPQPRQRGGGFER